MFFSLHHLRQRKDRRTEHIATGPPTERERDSKRSSFFSSQLHPKSLKHTATFQSYVVLVFCLRFFSSCWLFTFFVFVPILVPWPYPHTQAHIRRRQNLRSVLLKRQTDDDTTPCNASTDGSWHVQRSFLHRAKTLFDDVLFVSPLLCSNKSQTL